MLTIFNFIYVLWTYLSEIILNLQFLHKIYGYEFTISAQALRLLQNAF
jgi:hypothetical protein